MGDNPRIHGARDPMDQSNFAEQERVCEQSQDNGETTEIISNAEVNYPNSAHGGDRHDLGLNRTSRPGDLIQVHGTELEGPQAFPGTDQGAVGEACAKSEDDLYPGRAERLTLAQTAAPYTVGYAHMYPQRPCGPGHSVSKPSSPGGTFDSDAVTNGYCKNETTTRGDDAAPMTTAVKEQGAVVVCEPCSDLSDGQNLGMSPSFPEPTASIILVGGILADSYNWDNQRIGAETLVPFTLDQPRLSSHALESKSKNENSRVSDRGTDCFLADTTSETGSRPESLPNSSSTPNLSQPDPEMNTTPPSSRGMPALASPVQLQAEANLQSTPPSSPMKLSSPPPLNLLKKADRVRSGVSAPFRSPFPGPIRCTLPSSPFLPSSPPPMSTSSPPLPPTKKRRAAPDLEGQTAPAKVRRIGLSPFSLTPFVSPLRNSRGRGSSPVNSHTKPPAGGFSTPLRPSKIQPHNFSSPIMPSRPDVFTTPATAARSSSAYRAPRSSPGPSLDSLFGAQNTPVSSTSGTQLATHKLRPPRSVTRPFKPPAKSTRPTSATVQALKQRLQSLRNALRIRGITDPTRPVPPQSNAKVIDDGELEALALQWRDAAREAAQDLWALVRDSADENTWAKPSGNKEDNWGWETKPQRGCQEGATMEQGRDDVETDTKFTPPNSDKVHRALLKNLSRPVIPRRTMLPPLEDAYVPMESKEDEMDVEHGEDEPKHHTLGTMLTSLGIPHEVLGWQEEEGEFTDQR